jgi:hypothetical protein
MTTASQIAQTALTKIELERKDLAPYPFGKMRAETLGHALYDTFFALGCQLQYSPRIDAKGEFLLSASQGFGGIIANLLDKRARTGLSPGAYMEPHHSWCMLHHFEAEKILGILANSPEIWAVIHVAHDDESLAEQSAEHAANAGCHGILLISMDGHDENLCQLALRIKANKWIGSTKIGVNHLTLPLLESLQQNIDAGLDATWTDRSIHSDQKISDDHLAAANLLKTRPNHTLFCGVAFKYQRAETNPSAAANLARELGFVPTTSGPGTGKAANPERIQKMQDTQGGQKLQLALASGVTPENVANYKNTVTHILVATGISETFNLISIEKAKTLVANAQT